MTAGELLVEGRALLTEDLEESPVRIVVRDGIICNIEDLPSNQDTLPWIIPAFFNAHTHLGDSIAMDMPSKGTLDDLVKPPDGLKHRILQSASREDLVRGMRLTLKTMVFGGTAGCADFREGGTAGVLALRAAAEGIPCTTIVFGRDGGEDIAHGLGISSARDIPGGLDELVSRARQAKRLVAFHAGEKDQEDLDLALEYEPDLLIHCTHATRPQLRRIADLGIPVVVCPRANWTFRVASSSRHPPVRHLLTLGSAVLLGTDNVMCVQPDMWREMSFLSTVYRIPARDVLRAAMLGASVFSRPSFIAEGNRANFLLIDPRISNLCLSRDIPRTLVNRAGPADIVRKVINL
ncbi:MAG: amidohydrolase family protein [Methanolinea sp.]|nr:amidohydrolase family protein [Methanolinea sp.]